MSAKTNLLATGYLQLLVTFFKQTRAAVKLYQRFPPAHPRDTDLDGAQGLVGVVLVKVVDVS